MNDEIIKTEPVTLKMRFHEIFGKKGTDISPDERRARWEQWKKLAIQNNRVENIEYWCDSSECTGCRHKDNDWCKMVGLPCTVNPILSFKYGMPGFACQGVGRDSEPIQLQLW